MFHVALWCFCLTTIVIVSPLVWAGSLGTDVNPVREATAKLYDDLAKHRVFSNQLTPLPFPEVDVTFMIMLYKINGIKTATQTLKTGLYFLYLWSDHDLTWEPLDYGNTSLVSIPVSRAWVPSLQYSNLADGEIQHQEVSENVRLDSNGQFFYERLIFANTHCDLDLTFYPLDEQTCQIVLQSNGVDKFGPGTRAVFMEDHQTNDIISFYESITEWVIVSKSMSTHFNEHNYIFVKITLKMKRANLYYILCLLFPMMVTSLMTLLVFWIPPGSGEKMSYLVSIFVSLTIYFNYAGDTLPPSMSEDSLPRFAAFLDFVAVECVCAFIATIVVMRRYQWEQDSKIKEEITDTEREAMVASNVVSPDQSQASQTDFSQLQKEMHLPGHETGRRDGVFQRFSSKIAGVFTKNRSSSVAAAEQQETKGTSRSSCMSASKLDRIFFWVFTFITVPLFALIFVI